MLTKGQLDIQVTERSMHSLDELNAEMKKVSETARRARIAVLALNKAMKKMPWWVRLAFMFRLGGS